jgi:Ser/Thr protein kinase RdoA (MazF antagonist)
MIIESSLAHHPDDEHAGPGRRWMAMARSAVPWLLPALRDASRLHVSLQPCLRDARPEHFLFDGDRLSGLIDFGAMGIDCVATDLARLLGEWGIEPAPLPYGILAAYDRVRPLESSASAFVANFQAAADVLIAGHWLSWHFLEHRRFEDPGTVRDGITRGLARLERLTARRLQA